MSEMTLFVDYRKRDKRTGQYELETHTAEVQIRKAYDGDNLTPGYYAINLELWGCGKTAGTIPRAVQLLVQDQALICAIRSK